jgi:succinate dehydrogenase/fumarate reductase cytochrome b subunit
MKDQDLVTAKTKTVNPGKVRIIHRRLGIAVVGFLLVQALVGMLMGIERLASVEMSGLYNLLYYIHADWDPPGSIYRVILGVVVILQGMLGIMIYLNRFRTKTGDKAGLSTPSSLDKSRKIRKEVSMGSLSFASDIRPLFRDSDIAAMKPMGIDLSSYEDVKRRSKDISARLSAKEMPCDGPWSENHVQKFKEWMQSGMEP